MGYVLVTLLVIFLVAPLIVPIPPPADTWPVESLADADSRFIEVDGVQVHYKHYGSGEPTVILLHGFGASTFSWREVYALLSAYGTVIAYDRPGFGLTERPVKEDWEGHNPYASDAQVDLLLGLMDALEIQQAVLVGNSAGGRVALQTALDHPERVRSLGLVDAAVYDGGRPGWLAWLMRWPQVNRLGPVLMRGIRRWGMDVLQTAWHDPARVTPEVIAGYRRPLHAENWDRALWELTKAAAYENLSGRLEELDMPVLVMTGDDDRIIPTEDSLRLAEEIPGAELVVFAACGHVPQEECPQEFVEAMGYLLGGLGTDAVPAEPSPLE